MTRKNSASSCFDNSFGDDDEDSEDEWQDEETETLTFFPICSITEPQPTLSLALKYDVQQHNFNLFDYLTSADDEEFFEKSIVCINKCRSFVQSNSSNDDMVTLLKEYLTNQTANNDEDDEIQFFKPVLEDDNLIMCLDDLQVLQVKKNDMKRTTNKSKDSCEQHTNQVKEHIGKEEHETESVAQLKFKIDAIQEQLIDAKKYINNLTDNATTPNGNGNDDHKPKNKIRDNDTYYFNSYSHSSIHETMLKDCIRTEAYQNAILLNKHLFVDKVVVDIGCGTGVLSIFAAKAGAKKVIAIDASDVHKEAREIVQLNGFGGIIHVIHGKVENLILNKQLPLEDDEKVDVILSEWMGYSLFYETMLPSVLSVRDRFMDKENGTMWPNRSAMFIEGASDPRLNYWDDVYGINMTPMKGKVIQELRKESCVEVVDDNTVMTNRAELLSHNLNTCTDGELDFDVSFELVLRHKESALEQPVKIDKLVLSFDIDFDIHGCTPVSFSTGCQSVPTHWKQTSLWFDPSEAPSLGPGDVIKGTLNMHRNDLNQRDMDFVVRWEMCTRSINQGDKKKKAGVIVTKLSS
mmetsp:Transcript_20142/g.24830  ORF Transcript_20142/g.24830 Transcript_20142/m.24830 type:complete len:577 (+) Transcript_20142:76-1806(+)